MSSKNDVKKAHAAAAAKASRARLAALKNKASPAPTALQSVKWVKLMQACADAQAAAESAPSLAAWRGAVGAAAALTAEVGADDDSHDDDRCGAECRLPPPPPSIRLVSAWYASESALKSATRSVKDIFFFIITCLMFFIQTAPPTKLETEF